MARRDRRSREGMAARGRQARAGTTQRRVANGAATTWTVSRAPQLVVREMKCRAWNLTPDRPPMCRPHRGLASLVFAGGEGPRAPGRHVRGMPFVRVLQ